MKQWFESKTVALIGNAMYMFDREYGEEIESHDVVVRLNKAAVLYTKLDAHRTHGRRTDIWMFWNTSEYKNNFSRVNAKKMHMGHQGRYAGNITMVDEVYPNIRYQELKKHAGKHNNPTTGLLALDYINSCNPKLLSVYGFDWKATPTFTDPERKRDKLCPHDYPTEKEYCMKTFFSKPHIILKT